MWDLIKQIAQGGIALSREYGEQRAFVERLLALSVDDARRTLQAQLSQLDDQARAVLLYTLHQMASQEQRADRRQKLEVLAHDTQPPQLAAVALPSGTPPAPATRPAAPTTPATAQPMTIPANSTQPVHIPLQPARQHGPCNNCRYYRPVRPMSGLLTQAFGRYDATVQQTIGEVSRNERSSKDEEALRKIEIMNNGSDRWDTRPSMSSYCGLEEANGVYLIHEVKNRGQQCTDFSPGPAPQRRCNTCIYCVKGTGEKYDREMIAYHQGWINIPPSGNYMRYDPSVAQAALQDHQQSIGPRKAQEINAVAATDGVLAQKPFYLDYCRKFSNERFGQYVVCLTKNTHETCHEWTRACTNCGHLGRAGRDFCSTCGVALDSSSVDVVTLPTDPRGDPIVECGDYTFLLNRGKLRVWVPGAATGEQIYYDVSGLPMGEWHALQDGQGAALPVAVVNNRGQFQAKVGAQLEAGLRGLAPIGRQQQIIELFLGYDHPDNGYRVTRNDPKRDILWVRDPVTTETFDVDVSGLRNGKWRVLRDSQNRELPIKVGREKGQLMLEWL